MADEEGFLLNGKPISELRVVDLKKELDQRGLSKVGSKVQLTERLKAQLLLEKRQSEPHASSDEAVAPNRALQDDEGTGQNDFIKQYLAQQQRNLERQMQLKKKLHEERERSSAAESAEDSQPSAAEDEMSKEVTSDSRVKVTEAPAHEESGDSEMARSRKSRHASKEEKRESKQKDVKATASDKGDTDMRGSERKSSRRRRSPSPENIPARDSHRSGSSSRSRSRSPEKTKTGRGKKSRRLSGGKAVRGASTPSRSPSPKAQSPEPTSRRSSRKSTAYSTKASESRVVSVQDNDAEKSVEIEKEEPSSRRRKSGSPRSAEQLEELAEPSHKKSPAGRSPRKSPAGKIEPEMDRGQTKVPTEQGETSEPKEVPATEQKSGRSSRWRRSRSGSKPDEVVAEIAGAAGKTEETTQKEQKKGDRTQCEGEKQDLSSDRDSGKLESVQHGRQPAEELKVEEKKGEKNGKDVLENKTTGENLDTSEMTVEKEKPKTVKEDIHKIDSTTDKSGASNDKEQKHLVEGKECEQKTVKDLSPKEKEQCKEDLKVPTDRQSERNEKAEPEDSSKISVKQVSSQENQKSSHTLVCEEERSQKESGKETVSADKSAAEGSRQKPLAEVSDPQKTKTEEERKSEPAAACREDSVSKGKESTSSEPAVKPARRTWGSKSKEREQSSEQDSTDAADKGSSKSEKVEQPKAFDKEKELIQGESKSLEIGKKDKEKEKVGDQQFAQTVHMGKDDDNDRKDERADDKTIEDRDVKEDIETKNDSKERNEEIKKTGRKDNSETGKKDTLDDAKKTEHVADTKKRDTSRSRSRSQSPVRNKMSKRKRDRSASSSDSRSGSRSSSEGKMRSRSGSKSSSRSRSSSSSSSSSGDGDKPTVRGSVSKFTQKRSRSPAQKPRDDREETVTADSKGSKRPRKSAEVSNKEIEIKSLSSKVPRLDEQEDKEESGKNVPYDKSDKGKVESRTFRRFGSTNKVPSNEGTKIVEEATLPEDKDKPVRKRKWGSRQNTSSKRTMEISTDSLKGLIDDVKLPTEPVLELEAGEAMFLDAEEQSQPQVKQQVLKKQPQQQQQQDMRDVKIKRTVVVREDEEMIDDTRRVETSDTRNAKKKHSSDEENEPEAKPKTKKLKIIKRDTEVKTVKKEPAEVKEKKTEDIPKPQRQLSQPLVPADEPETCQREQSPPRKPVNTIIHIINLVRPFTLGQLKQLLSRTGTLMEPGFWINSIKSHCYATFETEEQAMATRKALHGARWPQSNPKTLRVDFADKEEMDRRRAQEEGGVAPPPRPAPVPEKKESTPPPVKERRASGAEPDKKREERSVREWDRGKRSRTPDRAAGRTRSRSRERVRDKDRQRERERRHREQERSKERKEKKQAEPPKVEEEPPAKLLDDLFRKTKATPCIYWLPLTEEQAKKRQQAKQEKMAADKKKREEVEAEQEAARKKQAETHRRDGPSPARDRGGDRERQRDREDNRGLRDRERERERERDRQRDRERSRDDRDRRRGGRSGSRDRSGRQERSRSRDRRRR